MSAPNVPNVAHILNVLNALNFENTLNVQNDRNVPSGWGRRCVMGEMEQASPRSRMPGGVPSAMGTRNGIAGNVYSGVWDTPMTTGTQFGKLGILMNSKTMKTPERNSKGNLVKAGIASIHL